MARNRKQYDEEYEYEDEEEEETTEKGSGSKSLFMVILGVLLLALTVLCVLLTGKLRAANTEVEGLQTKLKEAETVKWNAPQETPAAMVPTETVPIPSPVISTTPAPTATPVPTATPAPVVVTAGGLPSWLTEENMAKITRRPKDDEWYGSPGKLYVTATLGLNLRSGLRTDINNIITQIKCGSEVMVYAASGNMRFVQDPKGNFGWVSSKLLSNEPPKGVTVIPFATVSVSTPTPVSTPAAGADDKVPVPEAPIING